MKMVFQVDCDFSLSLFQSILYWSLDPYAVISSYFECIIQLDTISNWKETSNLYTSVCGIMIIIIERALSATLYIVDLSFLS